MPDLNAVRAPGPEHLPDQVFASLARQLFFPPNAPARKSVLLVAADTSTNLATICHKLAKTLAKTSRQNVVIVQPTGGFDQGAREAVEVSEGLWQMPSPSWCAQSNPDDWSHGTHKERFDFSLVCASTLDGDLPTFCAVCDAAVLVITANVTRREAALSAKNMLMQLRVKLIGAILDRRTFPIPESIYRKL
jgi:hypothetical protein